MKTTFELLQLEELMKALENEEFQLYYQPKVHLATGKILGVEALIRWIHPKKGMIQPSEFIPLTEKTGFIIPLGEWVLRTACTQIRHWQKQGLPPMVMAVNLSVCQLYQQNLVDMVQQVLKETNLAPELLELEITEGIMMDKDQALPIIKELKCLGVQISLDDFGTGYSALHYLTEFPISKIKIDRSFVFNCPSGVQDATIVKTMINMARDLQIDVIAEGIENQEQLIFLQQNFCEQGQGYLFSMPLSPEEFISYFQEIEQIVYQEGIPPEIYKQKWMKEVLENARQELKDTVSQQHGMIFKFVKKNGQFIHTLCDGKLMYRMGLTPEQAIGKELKDFLPKMMAEEKIKYYQRAWEGEENITYEGELNGIFYFASLSPIRKNGQINGVIGSCVDITEQKKTEETLRMSNFKYNLITENMHDLIVMLDKNGTILYASPSHEKILGIPAKEYEGSSAFDLVHLEDVSYIEEQISSSVTSKTPCQVEFRHKYAQEGWIYIEAKIAPVFNENEKVEYFIAVGRNITSRKKTEEAMRK
jgi:PAS domain S-box-containing protein